MILQPSDDGPLQQLLDKWLTAMRKAYNREAKKWRDEIARLKTGTPETLKLASEAERRQRIENATSELNLIESKNPIDGVPCKGRLNLTLAKVKRGCEGIRDAWLHEQWAKKNGEDLVKMAGERRVFRRWLETHTGTPANVLDFNTRQIRQEIAPPSFGKDNERNPPFQEARAKVRFRARFADNAETVVYLAECELREELTAPELDEAKAATRPAEAAALAGLRWSPNFRQVFWNEQGKEQQANLTRMQATAFAALFNAEGRILAREEWQQEIYGDSPPAIFAQTNSFVTGTALRRGSALFALTETAIGWPPRSSRR